MLRLWMRSFPRPKTQLIYCACGLVRSTARGSIVHWGVGARDAVLALRQTPLCRTLRQGVQEMVRRRFFCRARLPLRVVHDLCHRSKPRGSGQNLNPAILSAQLLQKQAPVATKPFRAARHLSDPPGTESHPPRQRRRGRQTRRALPASAKSKR